HLLRLAHPSKTEITHDPSGLIPPERPPLPEHDVVHLADSVDAVVRLVQSGDLGAEQLVREPSRRGRAGLRGAIAAGGDEPTFRRAQHAADGLDPETMLHRVDESDHLVVGRSSSAAKNADAAFRISFARRSSAFSFFNRFNSACSTEVIPGRAPESISDVRRHFRNASVLTPSLVAT